MAPRHRTSAAATPRPELPSLGLDGASGLLSLGSTPTSTPMSTPMSARARSSAFTAAAAVGAGPCAMAATSVAATSIAKATETEESTWKPPRKLLLKSLRAPITLSKDELSGAQRSQREKLGFSEIARLDALLSAREASAARRARQGAEMLETVRENLKADASQAENDVRAAELELQESGVLPASTGAAYSARRPSPEEARRLARESAASRSFGRCDDWNPFEFSSWWSEASVWSNATTVEDILANPGLTAEQPSRPDDAALAWAAEAGYLPTCRHLLSQRADPDALCRNNMTPLMLASAGGHAAVVKLLLDVRADPDAVDLRGKGAIQRSVYGGHTEVTTELLLHMKVVSGDFLERLVESAYALGHEACGNEVARMCAEVHLELTLRGKSDRGTGDVARSKAALVARDLAIKRTLCQAIAHSMTHLGVRTEHIRVPGHVQMHQSAEGRFTECVINVYEASPTAVLLAAETMLENGGPEIPRDAGFTIDGDVCKATIVWPRAAIVSGVKERFGYSIRECLDDVFEAVETSLTEYRPAHRLLFETQRAGICRLQELEGQLSAQQRLASERQPLCQPKEDMTLAHLATDAARAQAVLKRIIAPRTSWAKSRLNSKEISAVDPRRQLENKGLAAGGLAVDPGIMSVENMAEKALELKEKFEDATFRPPAYHKVTHASELWLYFDTIDALLTCMEALREKLTIVFIANHFRHLSALGYATVEITVKVSFPDGGYHIARLVLALTCMVRKYALEASALVEDALSRCGAERRLLPHMAAATIDLMDTTIGRRNRQELNRRGARSEVASRARYGSKGDDNSSSKSRCEAPLKLAEEVIDRTHFEGESSKLVLVLVRRAAMSTNEDGRGSDLLLDSSSKPRKSEMEEVIFYEQDDLDVLGSDEAMSDIAFEGSQLESEQTFEQDEKEDSDNVREPEAEADVGVSTESSVSAAHLDTGAPSEDGVEVNKEEDKRGSAISTVADDELPEESFVPLAAADLVAMRRSGQKPFSSLVTLHEDEDDVSMLDISGPAARLRMGSLQARYGRKIGEHLRGKELWAAARDRVAVLLAVVDSLSYLGVTVADVKLQTTHRGEGEVAEASVPGHGICLSAILGDAAGVTAAALAPALLVTVTPREASPSTLQWAARSALRQPLSPLCRGRRLLDYPVDTRQSKAVVVLPVENTVQEIKASCNFSIDSQGLKQCMRSLEPQASCCQETLFRLYQLQRGAVDKLIAMTEMAVDPAKGKTLTKAEAAAVRPEQEILSLEDQCRDAAAALKLLKELVAPGTTWARTDMNDLDEIGPDDQRRSVHDVGLAQGGFVQDPGVMSRSRIEADAKDLQLLQQRMLRKLRSGPYKIAIRDEPLYHTRTDMAELRMWFTTAEAMLRCIKNVFKTGHVRYVRNGFRFTPASCFPGVTIGVSCHLATQRVHIAQIKVSMVDYFYLGKEEAANDAMQQYLRTSGLPSWAVKPVARLIFDRFQVVDAVRRDEGPVEEPPRATKQDTTRMSMFGRRRGHEHIGELVKGKKASILGSTDPRRGSTMDLGALNKSLGARAPSTPKKDDGPAASLRKTVVLDGIDDLSPAKVAHGQKKVERGFTVGFGKASGLNKAMKDHNLSLSHGQSPQGHAAPLHLGSSLAAGRLSQDVDESAAAIPIFVNGGPQAGGAIPSQSLGVHGKSPIHGDGDDSMLGNQQATGTSRRMSKMDRGHTVGFSKLPLDDQPGSEGAAGKTRRMSSLHRGMTSLSFNTSVKSGLSEDGCEADPARKLSGIAGTRASFMVPADPEGGRRTSRLPAMPFQKGLTSLTLPAATDPAAFDEEENDSEQVSGARRGSTLRRASTVMPSSSGGGRLTLSGQKAVAVARETLPSPRRQSVVPPQSEALGGAAE